MLLREMYGLFYVFQSLRVTHTIKVYFSDRLEAGKTTSFLLFFFNVASERT